MVDILLKFTKVLKNSTTFYRFEGFENVDSRWELPCEYLSGPHFAAWNGVLLYSGGNSIHTLCPGNLISLSEYQELMEIVEIGKERLREIKNKMSI
ncbi:hypothetical protein MSBRW_1816 [Methanosarcina barkeri str. Wiesmoor]|uniref:Uncharacterized protein n=2 Tax=Methanosarcina barkeri TaxID=2208 RepID=A0A0E3QLI2_METBA|nr:hypothetical protein [Methanosarcina barkeri]AKB51069.1 hypothetical protein MSBRW_1816 [Methanosarcina barkeri str. Wiesmoor]